MTDHKGNAAERAYAAVRARIVSGELGGGDLLSEVEVAEELGISRTPTHEAFLRLSAEQLLTLFPRRGAVVTPVTLSEAADVLVMRQGIECAAATQTCRSGSVTADVRQAISANLERQQEFVDAVDVAGFVEADDEFHALVVSASGNPIATHFYEQLRGRQQRLRNVLLSVDPANLAAAHGDHRALAESLFAGDHSRYRRLLAAHFDRYQGAI